MWNFKLHWTARLALNLTVLNLPLFLFWQYPFLFWEYKLHNRQVSREKDYTQAHMKPWEEIKVWTPVVDSAKLKIQQEGAPVPFYHSDPSEEDIQKHGLFIIGRS